MLRQAQHRLWWLGLVAIQIVHSTHAQDVMFSQHVFNPIYLNPAMAGITGGPRFIANYRNQWPALNNAYVTYSFSYDQHFQGIGGGVGFQLISDNQADGAYRQAGFSGMYNYLFAVSDKIGMRIGLQAGMLQRRILWEKLLYGDQFDPQTTTIQNPTTEMYPDLIKKTSFDVGAGAVVYGKKAYGGISVKHVAQPNVSLYQTRRSALTMLLNINLGAEIKTKRQGRTYISPNLMYASQGRLNQVQGHLLIYRGPVLTGMGLRHSEQNTDALIFYAGLRTGMFRSVYSYDNTFSNLRGRTGGAHELSIMINVSDGKKARRKQRLKNSIECPELL